jgi:tetratricopeptide (TPR) repeat protein
MPNVTTTVVASFITTFLLSSLAVAADTSSPAVAKKATATKVLPKRKAKTKSVTTETPPAAPTDTANEPDDDVETMARKSPVNVDSKNTIRLNYGRREWNSNPTQLDSAVIFLREGASGRIVQIEAEETAPDSAVFSGNYSINWQNLDALQVEFFAPPQKLLADMTGRKKITQMIESKELRRLPFVLRKDPVTGVQNIELFDNVDQARLAYRAFQAEQELLVALKNRLATRDQTLDTAMLASERAELEESSRNLAERVRMSQIETQRLSQLLQGYSSAPQEERQKRKADAQAAADQAMLDYRAGRLPEARKSFETAVELDPSNRTYYFQYGVTLYKLEDFNRALVYLDLADSKGLNNTEREFYRGLSYYRLKDSTAALGAFENVVAAKDPVISPSARFYRGIIFFEKKKWTDARPEFQGVLDESKDPALDERAEAYLENILRQQQFDAERARRWSITGTFGEMYDDNVLLSSDSDRDQGVATNKEAFRTLLVGSARYRPIYEETSEFAIQADVMTMLSVDTSFQSSQTLSNADPTVIGLSAPWTHKGLLLGKGHKFDFVPGVEATYMSVENNEWKMIYNSLLAGFQNLFIIDDFWLTSVNIDLRRDSSQLSSSTGDDDSSALKSKISWSNINFLADKKQIILSDFAYTLNNSQGKNSEFNRIDLGVGYVRPFLWDTTFSSKLSYFLLTYTQNASGRVDNSYSLTLGLTRKVWENVTGGFATTYNINNSNVTANQYKKLNVMLTLTANNAF